MGAGGVDRRNREQYCLGSSVANRTCRSCSTHFVHMHARRLHERYCAGIGPDVSGDLFWSCLCGFEVHMPLGATKWDKATTTHKKYVHHENCRGGGDAQITCPRT